MKFEWDAKKNEANKNRYGISFEEAQTAFDDPLHLSKLDKRFNYFEERWITIGATSKQKIILVAHLYFFECGEEVIRIISARKAISKERKQYGTYE